MAAQGAGLPRALRSSTSMRAGSPWIKASVETAIESLKSAMANNDTAAMNKAMEQLTHAQHKAAEALYKQAGTAAAKAMPVTASAVTQKQHRKRRKRLETLGYMIVTIYKHKRAQRIVRCAPNLPKPWAGTFRP